MGEGDFFLEDELEEHLRFVSSRINLLASQDDRDVRDPPGVDVKHGGDRHVYVARPEAAGGIVGTERHGHAHGVKDELPVRKEDPLGRPGGPRRVEGRRPGVFIQIGKMVSARRRVQHVLVDGVELPFRLHLFVFVNDDELLHRLQLVPDLIQDREKIRVDDDDIVIRVVHRVKDLIRRKPPVHRVEDRTHHGNGKETFQVAVAVVIEDAHRVALLHSQGGERSGQLVYAGIEIPVRVPEFVPIDDFLIRRVGERGRQQPLDEQRIRVALSRTIRFSCHRSFLLFWLKIFMPPPGYSFPARRGIPGICLEKRSLLFRMEAL